MTGGGQAGTLYGLGVGPGDPDLLTIKAAQVLGLVDVVFTASASKNEDSLAAKIAAPHLRPEVPCLKLGFPMTSDREVLERAWEDNARQVAAQLSAGRSAAFLTLGDCLTYSTYAYLLDSLKIAMPEAKVVSVPGVARYQLAAARLNRPLVLGRETLAVLGGAGGDDAEALIESADNLAILKSYRDTPAMLAHLGRLGLLGRTALCANLALPGEVVIDPMEGSAARIPGSYFSLMLVNKRPRG